MTTSFNLYYLGTEKPRPRHTTKQHRSSVEAMRPDESYSSAEALFSKYFDDKKKMYHEILTKRLDPKKRILSVGSGRCVNELRLISEGYDITCSDVGSYGIASETKELVPRFIYEDLDILTMVPPVTFDQIFSLGVAYCFNDEELEKCFENIAKGSFVAES